MEQADCHDKAVLWPLERIDSHGKPVVGQPEELDVRWVEKRREVSDNQGGTITIEATVIVDQKIVEGSQMWKGRIEDLPAGVDFSTELQGLMHVQSYTETPDVKGRVARRKVMLTRANNTLPAG